VDKEIAAACDPQALSDDEEVEAIKKELTQNPEVNDAEVIPEFLKAPTAHKPQPLPSEAEQKKAMEQALAETKAAIGK
jgi:hypothetical protein